MENNASIQSAIDNGYDLDIMNYFSKAWELFKQNPGGYIGYIILFFIISMVVGMIPFLGFIIGIIVSPALGVGIALAAHRHKNHNEVEFGNFFKGFDYMGQLIVAYIIMLVIYFILALPLIFYFGITIFTSIGSGDPEAAFDTVNQIASLGGWLILYMGVFLYVGVSFRWTYYFIVFHKYDAVSAIKASWKIINKKWLSHFLFILACVGVGLIGVIALVIGLVVAYPIIMMADYEGYADVTGLNRSHDVIDEIGMDTDLV